MARTQAETGQLRGPLAEFEGADPLQWAQEPHARLSHTVVMAAEDIPGEGEVQYRFVCTSGNAASGDWQDSREHRVTECTPNTAYTFTAEARSKADRQPLRAAATPITVTTPPADTHDRRLENEVELVPLLVSGDKDNRINIIVANRWVRPGSDRDYNRPEMRDEFLEDARHILRGMTRGDELALEPFATMRGFFNVYALWWPGIPPWDPENRETGLRWDDYNALRDRLFLPWQLQGRGWVTHLAMFNSDGGGGGAGRRLEERVGDAMIAGNETTAFFHEFSHTAMGLGDKYIGWGVWGGPAASDESPVATRWARRDRVRWKAWIEPDTPVPTPYDRENLRKIGIFEGATHRLGYIFRATPVCIMGVSQFSECLCPICIQQATQRTYRWVDVFDAVTPVRKELVLRTPGRARFAVRRVKPDPDTHRVEWRLNGALIATGTDEVRVPLGALPDYTLTCSVVDETALIRPDPPYSAYPRAETSWHIRNPSPTSEAAPFTVALASTPADCWGRANGTVSATGTGGKPPYAYEWSNGGTDAQIAGLAPGVYGVRVTDSEYRTAEAQTRVERPVSFSVDPHSTQRDGRWHIALAIRGGNAEEVTCRWSNGAEGPVLAAVPAGTYRYTLTHRSGATYEGSVTVATPAAPLRVAVADLIPSTGENNGQVRLEPAGGSPPYRVSWSDSAEVTARDRLFLRPGRYTARVRDANETVVETPVDIREAEPFEIPRPVFDTTGNGAVRIANPAPGFRYVWYDRDRPLHLMRPPRGLYEGTFTTADGREFEASGAVIPATNGKWITPTDEHANDFTTWVRLDVYVEGRDAFPHTVKLQTQHDGRPGAELQLRGDTTNEQWMGQPGETFLRAEWTGLVAKGRLVLDGEGPDAGHFDLAYSGFHENPAEPLRIGDEFHPPKPGNYYVAARREDTGALSTNRIGVAIAMGRQAPAVEPLPPDGVTGCRPLLWLDASDMDADGQEDSREDFWTWERGIVHGWKGKAEDIGFRIMHYLPNAQNGKAVCDFRYLWLQQTTRPVSGFQTAILVYREHDLSAPGTSPWRDAPFCFWDLKDTPDLLKTIPEAYRQAVAYRDGERVDPFATPPPLDGFCIATFELPEPTGRLHNTHTNWEGCIAELVLYNGKLEESERRRVEEHLRRKWIAEVTLPQP